MSVRLIIFTKQIEQIETLLELASEQCRFGIRNRKAFRADDLQEVKSLYARIEPYSIFFSSIEECGIGGVVERRACLSEADVRELNRIATLAQPYVGECETWDDNIQVVDTLKTLVRLTKQQQASGLSTEEDYEQATTA